jgi:hypothetical protein
MGRATRAMGTAMKRAKVRKRVMAHSRSRALKFMGDNPLSRHRLHLALVLIRKK